MFILYLFAVILSIIIGFFNVRFKIEGKRSIEAILSIVFLFVQAVYLLLVLFDNTVSSETWIGLALTYVPLSIFFFIILTFICLIKAIKMKNKKQYLITFSILAFHGIVSSLILLLWAEVFNFPI